MDLQPLPHPLPNKYKYLFHTESPLILGNKWMLVGQPINIITT
jgi:hypothetical protein